MADFIQDYQTVNTSADLVVGSEARDYSAKILDSINAGATLKFGRAFQRKAGLGIAMALSDVALINATQSMRIAQRDTSAGDYDNENYIAAAGNVKADRVVGAKCGYYVVDVEEPVTESDTVRVRVVTNSGDPLKVPGRFTKTLDASKTCIVEGAHFIEPNIVFFPPSVKLVLDI